MHKCTTSQCTLHFYHLTVRYHTLKLNQMKSMLCLTVAVLFISGSVAIHPSHYLAHEMFKRQATTVEDCTIDDCMIDDGCITEESYNAGTFDPCYVETLQIGFTQSTVAVDENAAMVTLTIELNQNAWVTEPVVVTYSTSETVNPAQSMATSNVDYTAVNGQVTFAIGECTKEINIPILANPETEDDEVFLVDLATDCCADVTIGQVEVTIEEDTIVQGDPHFTIPLMSGSLLCYSIQGYPGLAFNLISNKHIAINAMFIDSVNDKSEATWIGKLAIVPRGGKDYQTIVLDSTSQDVIIDGQGNFKASVVEELHIYGHNNISVRFTKGMARQSGNPVVRVTYAKPTAIFDITFHDNHLDVDWKMQDDIIRNSHGLMGQFMAKGITIDPVKEMLIRPGFESVPVEKTTTWIYNKGQTGNPCWKAMNPGHQGEGLIEGSILSYIVDNILDDDFVFKDGF